jgi:anti-sigma factor ChrR (cupin superfamily)
MERAREKSFTLITKAERTWQASGVPGVEICQLWLDGMNERHTTLIRMQGGTSLPAHLHGGTEECYVVQGDLHDRGNHLRAGDYVRFEAGTSHTVSSNEGCILLIAASLHDQLVPSL